MEVLATPKRTKSADTQSGDLQKPSGWDAAFRPTPKTTNGEGNHILSNGQLASPEAEAIDFDHFLKRRGAAGNQHVVQVQGKKRKEKKRPRQVKSVPAEKKAWRFSPPIGGRMINADPVFTADEKYVAKSYVKMFANVNQVFHCCKSKHRSRLLHLEFTSHPINQIEF